MKRPYFLQPDYCAVQKEPAPSSYLKLYGENTGLRTGKVTMASGFWRIWA